MSKNKNRKKQNRLHIFIELLMISLIVIAALLLLRISDENAIQKMNLFLKHGDISLEGSVEKTYNPNEVSFTSKALSESELMNFENSIKNKEKMNYLHEYLKKFVTENHLENDVDLEYSYEGIYLVFKDSILFGSGESKLKNSAKGILHKITNLLLDVENNIFVEGHTDNVPINSKIYSSNWDLASKRAISVIEFFETQGIPSERFIAMSYADTKPLTDNTTEEEREKNRRVVIYVKQNY